MPITSNVSLNDPMALGVNVMLKSMVSPDATTTGASLDNWKGASRPPKNMVWAMPTSFLSDRLKVAEESTVVGVNV